MGPGSSLSMLGLGNSPYWYKTFAFSGVAPNFIYAQIATLTVFARFWIRASPSYNWAQWEIIFVPWSEQWKYFKSKSSVAFSMLFMYFPHGIDTICSGPIASNLHFCIIMPRSEHTTLSSYNIWWKPFVCWAPKLALEIFTVNLFSFRFYCAPESA